MLSRNHLMFLTQFKQQQIFFWKIKIFQTIKECPLDCQGFRGFAILDPSGSVFWGWTFVDELGFVMAVCSAAA